MGKSLFVKNSVGKVFELRGRNADRVHRALLENHGQAELVRLIEAGYVEFVDKAGEAQPIDALTAEQFH